jgi:hypothetical protein
MPSTLLTCSDDTELLALALGEPLDPAVVAHVDKCATCQANRDRIKAQVALVRQNHGRATTPPSTENDAATDSQRQLSGASSTQDRPSADPAGTLGPDRFDAEIGVSASQKSEPAPTSSRHTFIPLRRP